MSAHNLISEMNESQNAQGKMFSVTSSAPSAGASGYSKGALWMDTSNGALHVNAGTSSSASWALVGPNQPLSVVGSRVVASMFRDAVAGTKSLDLLWVGDSNTSFLGGSGSSKTQGWCDAFQFAMWKQGAPVYASPLYPFHQNGSGPDERQGFTFKCDNLGLPSAGVHGGGGVGSTGVHSDNITDKQLLSGNLAGPSFITNRFKTSLQFGPSYYPTNTYTTSNSIDDKAAIDYAWYSDTGNRYHDSIAGIYIDADSPIGVSNTLIYRLVHGKFASGGGNLKLDWWHNVSKVNTTTISFAGTQDEIAVSTATLSAATRTSQVYALWGGDSRANGVSAKAALLLQSVYRQSIGTSSTPLCWWGGGTVNEVSVGSSNVGTLTLQTWLGEARTRQIAAGGTGKVVVCFHGGANPGSQTAASWVADFNSFAANMRSAWSALGYPSADLGFIAMVSHVKNAGDTDLSAIRALCRTTFASSQDVLFIDLGTLVPAEKMVFMLLYDSGVLQGNGSYDVHMSAQGYELLSDLALGQILALV
jgi:hypothetical protein